MTELKPIDADSGTKTFKGNLRNYHDRLWRYIVTLALWPKSVHLLGWLGARRFLKRTYRRLFGPDGGTVQLEVRGLAVKFYVHTKAMADGIKRLWGEKPMLEKMLQTVGPGDCVYDIGAEMGIFTCFLAAAVGECGRVIAFEPASEAWEQLQDNLALNRLSNVRVVRMALSDHNGDGTLFSGAKGHTPMLGDLGKVGMKFQVSEHVEVVQGDWLVAREKLPVPRAVKVDVEGYEIAVIQGLSRTLADKSCELLCCEIHPALLPAGATPDTVLGILDSLGFRQTLVSKRGEQLHAICRKA